MTDFTEMLKNAGILEEGHGYVDEDAIAKDLVNHLKSRIQMETELKELRAPRQQWLLQLNPLQNQSPPRRHHPQQHSQPLR